MMYCVSNCIKFIIHFSCSSREQIVTHIAGMKVANCFHQLLLNHMIAVLCDSLNVMFFISHAMHYPELLFPGLQNICYNCMNAIGIYGPACLQIQ